MRSTCAALAAVSLLLMAGAARADADSIALSLPAPLLAGGEITFTATGSTDPGADFDAAVTIKPAGGTCAPDPGSDDGAASEAGGTAGPDGGYSVDGSLGGAADTAGSYLVCGWLDRFGTVTAQTSRVVQVARPPVTIVVSSPSKLRRQRRAVSLGTIRYDVGRSDRLMDWSLQPASSGCRSALGAGTTVGVSGSGSYAVDIPFGTPRDGHYVICVFIGNANLKEIDGSAVSAIIAVGRATCVVPTLVGRSPTLAGRLVTGAGCSLGELRYVHRPRAKHPHVISQKPAPGRRVDAGTAVDVVVACARGNWDRHVFFCIGQPEPSVGSAARP